MLLHEQDGYAFETLDAANRLETGSVFADVFSTNEPLSVHLGLSHADWTTAWNSSYYAGLAMGSPTVVARHLASGAIVGVRLAGDLNDHWPRTLMGRIEHRLIDLIGTRPKLVLGAVDLAYGNALPLSIMAAVDNRAIDRWDRTYRADHLSPRTQARQVMLMLGVAVQAEHLGRGLGGRMTALTHAVALAQGYRHAVVKCSGAHPKRVFEQLGYRLCFEIPYDSVRFARRNPLRGVMRVDGGGREYSGGFYEVDLATLNDEARAVDVRLPGELG
jgi:hypothetical protein